MKIVGVKTYIMNAGDKNWLFVKIVTDEGIHGWGEGSLEGQEKTVEKAIQVLESPLLTRIRGGLSAYGKYFTVMDFGEEELSLILH